MSGPRSTIATSDDAPRAPSPVPTMTAAGARARIAASDEEIHSLTLEGPSCGGFSRPAAARTGYVVLRIEPGDKAARLAPWRGFQRLPVAHRAGGPRRWAWRPWRAFLALVSGPALPYPTGAAVVDSSGTSRPTPAGAARSLTLEGQRSRRDADT